MANGLGITVDGKTLVQPGVVAKTNISAFNQFNTSLQKRLAVIALAQGGVPQDLTLIRSVEQARAVLKNGAGLELVELAMNPSPAVPGAQEVLFYRLNAAIAASLDLGDLVVTASDINAGVYGNDIRIRRSAGANGGAIVEVENRASNTTIISQELGPAFEIEYVGANLTPAVEVIDNAGNKTLRLSDDTNTINIPLGQGTIRDFDDLEEYLASNPDWQGTAVDGHRTFDVSLAPVGVLTLTANVTNIDIGADAQAAFINTAEFVTAASAANAAVGVGAGWVPLENGSEGPVATNADYLSALDVLSNEDVQVIVTDSTDPDVHASVNAHCSSLSHPVERRERTQFCGIDTEATAAAQVAAALAAAKSLASERTMVVGTPLKVRNIRTERLEVLDAGRVAAAIAGMYCGLNPEEPLTFKPIGAEDVAFKFSSTQIDDMVKGGVLSIQFDRESGVHIITEGITSWLKDANAMRRTTTGVSIRDHLTRKLRRDTREFIGRVGDQFTVEQIKQRIIRSLGQEVSTPQNRGVLLGFDSVEVNFDGINYVEVRFNANPVGEVRNIFMEVFLLPRAISV